MPQKVCIHSVRRLLLCNWKSIKLIDLYFDLCTVVQSKAEPMEEEEMITIYECEYCNQEFNNPTDLEEHRQAHFNDSG